MSSPERQAVKEELRRLAANPKPVDTTGDKSAYKEFAAPFSVQLREVTKRVFQQYWRTPIYIYSKTALCILVVRPLALLPSSLVMLMFLRSCLQPLFIGFSFFQADTSQQGLQNQSVRTGSASAVGRLADLLPHLRLFSVFLLFTVFGQLVQQIMPQVSRLALWWRSLA